MRRLGGLLLVALIAGAALLGAPSAGAEAPQPQRVFLTHALGEDKLVFRPHFFLLSGVPRNPHK